MRYLRQFKRLQTLCIKGNPVVSSDDFHSFTISFIPSLVYLDFRMIMEEEVRWIVTTVMNYSAVYSPLIMSIRLCTVYIHWPPTRTHTHTTPTPPTHTHTHTTHTPPTHTEGGGSTHLQRWAEGNRTDWERTEEERGESETSRGEGTTLQGS